MSINNIIFLYFAIGISIFMGCVLNSVCCWFRLTDSLLKLRKELGLRTDEFRFNFFDFFILEGKGWDMSTVAQKKGHGIIFTDEYMYIPNISRLKLQCRKYHKRGFYSVIGGFLSFFIFFGWVAIKMSLTQNS